MDKKFRFVGFIFWMGLFCFSLTGCASKLVALKDNGKHETPFLKPAQQSAGSDETAVNTLRIFERLTDCGDMNENGHIFYLL